MTNSTTSFGDRVKARRVELRLSQEALAKAVGISQPAIRKIEAGGQTTHGRKLAIELETTLEWLETGGSTSAPSGTDDYRPSRSKQPQWPFPSIPEDQVRALPLGDLRALEGALALAIAQLKLKVQTTATGTAPISAARTSMTNLDDVEDQFHSDPTGLGSVPATTYAEYAALPPRNPKAVASGTVLVNVAPGEPHAANDAFEKVPELGHVLLAAGEGIEAENEAETGFVQFRRSFLRAVGASAKKARVVYARGDSMEPVIQDGAALLVVPNNDLKISDLAGGGVYAINYDGKMIVKTVARDRLTGQWSARSFNAAHPDIPLEDGKPVRILGRVVWAGSPLRDDHAGQWVRR